MIQRILHGSFRYVWPVGTTEQSVLNGAKEMIVWKWQACGKCCKWKTFTLNSHGRLLLRICDRWIRDIIQGKRLAQKHLFSHPLCYLNKANHHCSMIHEQLFNFQQFVSMNSAQSQQNIENYSTWITVISQWNTYHNDHWKLSNAELDQYLAGWPLGNALDVQVV